MSNDKEQTSAEPTIEICDVWRRELLDRELRIESLRFELRRAEGEANRVDLLRRTIVEAGDDPFVKTAKVSRLILACALPDVVRWIFRPLVRQAKRAVRLLLAGQPTQPYRVQEIPVGRERKRVMHAIANFMAGGSSQLVVDLIEGLGDSYEQEVLTGFLPSPVAYRGVIAHERRNLYEMVFFIRRYKPEFIHVHYWGDVDFAWYDKVFLAAKEVGCRVVENVNTPVAPYRSDLVSEYVYVSDYVMQQFGHVSNNEFVIHPGSDLRLFSKPGAEDASGIGVGMVYRLEPDKLNRASIEVFISVVRRCPDARIVIVGDGSLLTSYREAVLANGMMDAFLFMGSVPYKELPGVYARLGIFVAPVWKESFGQVSCFAMSMGIPVVGYRIGGIEEIVDDDSLLADPGDSEQLASIIVGLLDDSQRRALIGKRNRQRVLSLFSIEQMIQGYRQVYDRMMVENK